MCPGGSLASKPTWSNALGCSITPAFLFSGTWSRRNRVEEQRCTPTT
jgi:hypothetical protein